MSGESGSRIDDAAAATVNDGAADSVSEGRVDAPVSWQAAFARTALSENPTPNPLVGLLLAVAWFLFARADGSPLRDVAILAAVLLLHEGGHLWGMRAFGFTDLRMFFLPGFGAAAAGRKPGAGAFERAVVSLLGPLPGIVVAAPLCLLGDPGALRRQPVPVEAVFALYLASVNTLNLLPILPLDGGRFFQSVVFGRAPALDILFRLAAAAGLAWLATKFGMMFGFLAALTLLSLPAETRLIQAAARLRKGPRVPADVAALDVATLERLYAAADHATSTSIRPETRRKVLSRNISSLHDRAAQVPASLFATLGLLALWLVGLVMGVAEIALLSRRT